MNEDVKRWRLLAEVAARAARDLVVATENGDAEATETARKAAIDVCNAVWDEERARMVRLLPAWFNERMMFDVWSFGLVLVTGRTLRITSINDVTQAADGSLWLDVELAEIAREGDCWDRYAAASGWPPTVRAPTSRTACSVAVAHVVCAVELADT